MVPSNSLIIPVQEGPCSHFLFEQDINDKL